MSSSIFKSFLGPAMMSFLEWRQRLSYKDNRGPLLHLRDLDYYLVFYGIFRMDQINEGFVANWLHSIPSRAPGTKNNRLKTIRGFLRYLVRCGLAPEDASRNIGYLKEKPRPAYIYTLKELAALLEAARQWQRRRRRPFTGHLMESLVYLLYACGLRINEALNLKLEDIDLRENTLSLWNTKFNKERLLPFGPKTRQRLMDYLALRNQRYPQEAGSYVFCNALGRRYRYGTIKTLFKKLLEAAGIANAQSKHAPRLHDLRHAFACHRLYKWYQEGKNIANRLPWLSTYMGHVDIESTKVYLTVTRMLLREGNRLFQGKFEEIPAAFLKHHEAGPQ